VAQTVAAVYLEWKVESIFHEDSYGYRPNRSALDAVAKCRERCWKFDWVVDLDIQKFFDSVPRIGGGFCCMSNGGCARRSGRLTEPLLHVIAEPAGVGDLARAGQSVHALRVRRMDGAGSSPTSLSNGMWMTRSCTARPDARPRCWSR
jgi:hypothetical protein